MVNRRTITRISAVLLHKLLLYYYTNTKRTGGANNMKLILLFGIFLNPANIAYLKPEADGQECKIVFTMEKSLSVPRSCVQVMMEIERKDAQ